MERREVFQVSRDDTFKIPDFSTVYIPSGIVIMGFFYYVCVNFSGHKVIK